MKDLKDILEIVEVVGYEKKIIIIKVKKDCEYDLMANGFDPETIYFRCMRDGEHNSFTPIFKGFRQGATFEFGTYGHTLVSDSFREQRDKIWDYLRELNINIWRR